MLPTQPHSAMRWFGFSAAGVYGQRGGWQVGPLGIKHVIGSLLLVGLISFRFQSGDAAQHLSSGDVDRANSALNQLLDSAPAPLYASAASEALPKPLGPRELPPYAPPKAKVVLIGQGGQIRAAIATVDTLHIPDDSQRVIRHAVSAVTELTPQQVLVVANHSHAGPRLPGGVAVRLAYGDTEIKHSQLLNLFDTVTRKALRHYAPARLGLAEAPLPNYVGGRAKGAQVSIDNVLRLAVLQSDRQRIVLWSFAAHPTLVHRHHKHADGDYPARVAHLLKLEKDADEAVFLPGLTAQATPATVRQVDDYAALIASAISGLVILATNTMQSEANVNALELEVEVDAALPLPGLGRPFVLAPWATARLGSSDRRVKLVQLGPLRLVALPGEPSHALMGGSAKTSWVLGMAGFGMGYLVPPEDAHRHPERDLVLLGASDTQRVKELVQILRDGGDLSRFDQ